MPIRKIENARCLQNRVKFHWTELQHSLENLSLLLSNEILEVKYSLQ